MSFSLETLTLGGVGGAYPRLIQTGDTAASLVTGFTFRTGAGTAMPFGMQEDGPLIIGPDGFHHQLVSAASANRVVNLADSPGTLYPIDPSFRPILSVAPTDVNNTSNVTWIDSGISIQALESSTYEFYGIILAQASTTGTGVRLRFTGPADSTSIVAGTWNQMTNNSLGTNFTGKLVTELNEELANSGSPLANITFPIFFRGIVKTNSTPPASTFGVWMRSGTNGNNVKTIAGSYLRFQRIA
jgi:hypothetical protein